MINAKDLKPGVKIVHPNGFRLMILLVRNEWVWAAEKDGMGTPMTYKLQSIMDGSFVIEPPFKVGDSVRFVTRSNPTLQGLGKVLALDGGWAWVRFDRSTVPWTTPITGLEKVDPS